MAAPVRSGRGVGVSIAASTRRRPLAGAALFCRGAAPAARQPGAESLHLPHREDRAAEKPGWMKLAARRPAPDGGNGAVQALSCFLCGDDLVRIDALVASQSHHRGRRGVPTKSKSRRGGRRAGAGRPASHDVARGIYAMFNLVDGNGWSVRNAALAVVLMGEQAFAAQERINVAEIRRALNALREGSAPRQSLLRRAKSLQTQFERARSQIVAAGGNYLDSRLGGPGPWTPEEERPGTPCKCGQPWKFCGKCGVFLSAAAIHLCPAAYVQDVPLTGEHRHCDECRRPAPEPAAIARHTLTGPPGWWVDVAREEGTLRVPVTGWWMVNPVARLHPVTMQRQVVGWACSDHQDVVLKRNPRPQDWPVAELDPKPRLREPRVRTKKVRFDENFSGEKRAAMVAYECEDQYSDGDASDDEADRRVDELESLERDIDALGAELRARRRT